MESIGYSKDYWKDIIKMSIPQCKRELLEAEYDIQSWQDHIESEAELLAKEEEQKRIEDGERETREGIEGRYKGSRYDTT